MALSADRAGRKPTRPPARTSAPPPTPPSVPPPAQPSVPPMGNTGIPPSVGLAPLEPPPNSSMEVPLSEPPLCADGAPMPSDTAAGPASSDASTVQSIPLIPADTGNACPPATRPAAGEKEHGTKDAAAVGKPPAAGTTTPSPPARTRAPRYGMLIFLVLLVVLGGALYFLFFRPSPATDTRANTHAAVLTTTWSRVSGWLARTMTNSASTNQPPAGQKQMPARTKPGALKKTPHAATAPATSVLAHAVHQARQTVRDVQETRADFPTEFRTAPPVDTPTNKTEVTPPAPTTAEESRPQPTTLPNPPPPTPATTRPPEVCPVTPVAPATLVIEWPAVEVKAVVGSGRRGSAIVNDALLVIGEENDEGLLLYRIEPQMAVLRYKGETRRFAVKRRE